MRNITEVERESLFYWIHNYDEHYIYNVQERQKLEAYSGKGIAHAWNFRRNQEELGLFEEMTKVFQDIQVPFMIVGTRKRNIILVPMWNERKS